MLSDWTTNDFVSQYLKEEMEARNITQEDLRKVIGRKSQSYISDRLNGKSDWDLDELDKIARFIGFANAVPLIIDAYSKYYRTKDYEEREKAKQLEENARKLELAAYDVGKEQKRRDQLGDAYGQDDD